MMISKKVALKKHCKNSKGESSSTTTNVSIEEQLNEFKREKRVILQI